MTEVPLCSSGQILKISSFKSQKLVEREKLYGPGEQPSEIKQARDAWRRLPVRALLRVEQ